MDAQQAIYTKAVRHKSNEHKSLFKLNKKITCSYVQRNSAANNESKRCFDWEGC